MVTADPQPLISNTTHFRGNPSGFAYAIGEQGPSGSKYAQTTAAGRRWNSLHQRAYRPPAIKLPGIC